MITRILFPTDGSENSKKALSHLVGFAKQFNAEVLLLHVYELPDQITGFSGMYQEGQIKPSKIKEMEKNIIKFGNEVLDETAKQLNEDGVKFQKLLKSGSPKSTIVSTINSEKCDFVVIGSRGLSSIESSLIGSVSDYLLHHTDCPVLLIH